MKKLLIMGVSCQNERIIVVNAFRSNRAAVKANAPLRVDLCVVGLMQLPAAERGPFGREAIGTCLRPV